MGLSSPDILAAGTPNLEGTAFSHLYRHETFDVVQCVGKILEKQSSHVHKGVSVSMPFATKCAPAVPSLSSFRERVTSNGGAARAELRAPTMQLSRILQSPFDL